MVRRRDLSPDETRLWRRVAHTTKAYMALPLEPAAALPAKSIAEKPSVPELPHIALKRAKAQRAAKVPISKALSPVKSPIGSLVAEASGHKKVRRGKLDIDARIDLHGMRQIAAHTALGAIIARTRAENGRCILVVTGKGAPVDPGEDFITPQRGVIRRRLPEWLNGPGIREHVSGFAPANAKDGGSGAFYVLLKRNVTSK
jgi:DNA-nicking Smr family endonuclease